MHVPSITMQATVTSTKLQYLLSIPDYSVARNNSSHLRNSLAHSKLVPHVEMHSPTNGVSHKMEILA